MTEVITGKYLGNKKTELTHQTSGRKIQTAAPKDNNGDGSSFSPTDLVASALGACMMTVMAINAEKLGLDLTGMHSRVEKHMSANPRRIAKLPLAIHLPQRLSEQERSQLEQIARSCPVCQSLHPETVVALNFEYDV